MTVQSISSYGDGILSDLKRYTSLASEPSRRALSPIFDMMSRKGFEDIFLEAYFKGGIMSAYVALLETIFAGRGWKRLLPVDKKVKTMIYYQLVDHREWLTNVMSELLREKTMRLKSSNGSILFHTDHKLTIDGVEYPICKRILTNRKRVVAQVVVPWSQMCAFINKNHPTIFESFLMFIQDGAVVLHDSEYGEEQSNWIKFLSDTPLVEPLIEPAYVCNREYHDYPQFLIHLQNPEIRLMDITINK